MVRFFFDQFLFGLGRRLPLVAALVLVFALLFVPDVNKSFGLRNLLWHEEVGKQLTIGFALGVLVVQALVAGYLLETQCTPPDDRPRFFGLNAAASYALGVLASGLVLALPVFAAVGPTWEAPLDGWPLTLGMAAALAISIAGIARLPDDGTASWVGRLGNRIFNTMSRIKLLRVPRADVVDMPMHGVAVLAMFASVVFYLIVGWGQLGVFSPLIGVFAFGGILVAGYGFVEYFLDFVQPGLALILVALVYMGGLSRYGQRFPRLDRLYDADRLVHLADYDPARSADLLPPESIAFCEQARGPYRAGQKRPLVVVCVSGGGLRAAAWTTAVLHQLEQTFARHVPPIDFPCHIRLITGASGGMVGAGYYVANLSDPPETPFRRTESFFNDQYRRLTDDCLSPLVHALTYRDLRSVFSPFGQPYDRGHALEEAWTRNLGGALDLSFDRLKAGEAAGWRPSLVYAPMLVEDGRRLLISNLDLRGVASNDGAILQPHRDPQADPSLPLRKQLNRFSHESYEFFRLFTAPDVRRTFAVATAARMSASFPYVSPSPTLPTVPRRRVVDAGYYDNDGVSLAASWLFSGANRDWIRRNASKIVLVQIRDGASEGNRKLPPRPAPDATTALSRGLEFLTTPPAALFAARVGSSSFRNDGLLEILSQQLVSELQLKPVLAELRDDEIRLLQSAKAIETATVVSASLSGRQRERLIRAMEARQPVDEAESQKIEDYLWLVGSAQLTPEAQARYAETMKKIRLDDRPDLWADRMLREAELQAASLSIPPETAQELRGRFVARRHPDPDGLLKRVRRTFDRDAAEPYFVTVDFEFDGEASLSWYLTTAEKQRIRAAAGKLSNRIDLLIRWWTAPTAEDP
jgi:hypothetical protein